MAKIWPVYEGREPTRGGPWADIPAAEAIELFELRKSDFLSDLKTSPKFGNVEQDFWYYGYKHVVVELKEGESRKIKWKSGFYRSSLEPDEAFGKLIEQALVAKLGAENVLRVDYEPSVDSQGRDAIKVTVVISPNATENLIHGEVLDAMVSLQNRLHEMREERAPIIEFVTEAELQADAGP